MLEAVFSSALVAIFTVDTFSKYQAFKRLERNRCNFSRDLSVTASQNFIKRCSFILFKRRSLKRTFLHVLEDAVMQSVSGVEPYRALELSLNSHEAFQELQFICTHSAHNLSEEILQEVCIKTFGHTFGERAFLALKIFLEGKGAALRDIDVKLFEALSLLRDVAGELPSVVQQRVARLSVLACFFMVSGLGLVCWHILTVYPIKQ